MSLTAPQPVAEKSDGDANSAANVRNPAEAAPVALFVYARPDHTRRTLDALAANRRASETDLLVFADGARTANDLPAVEEVRKLVRQAKGFRSVEICERPVNLGLAGNIADGVTTVVERYGRIIVLEDDIVTSPLFLDFMNDALDRYQGESRVWHVNGWTYPVRTQAENRAFFTSVMECWGWATWSDRWKRFEHDPHRFLGKWDRARIRRFNIGGGYDYWRDLRICAQGIRKTWAVFWYATIFERDGLCISPPQSYATNIGIDRSGMNSGSRNIFADVVPAGGALPEWPSELTEDVQAWASIRDFLLSKRPWWGRRFASQVKWRLKSLLRDRPS